MPGISVPLSDLRLWLETSSCWRVKEVIGHDHSLASWTRGSQNTAAAYLTHFDNTLHLHLYNSSFQQTPPNILVAVPGSIATTGTVTPFPGPAAFCERGTRQPSPEC
jgi:hypothetical protein